jgi:hypothetical protein
MLKDAGLTKDGILRFVEENIEMLHIEKTAKFA